MTPHLSPHAARRFAERIGPGDPAESLARSGRGRTRTMLKWLDEGRLRMAAVFDSAVYFDATTQAAFVVRAHSHGATATTVLKLRRKSRKGQTRRATE